MPIGIEGPMRVAMAEDLSQLNSAALDALTW